MVSRCWRTGPFSALAVLTMSSLLTGCGTARHAYVQPQHYGVEHRIANPQPALASLTASADSLPPVTSLARLETSRPAESARLPGQPSAAVTRPIGRPVFTSPDASRHRNPDSYVSQRARNPFGLVSANRVPPRRHAIDPHSLDRKTHPLALVALGLSVGAYAPLILSVSGTLGLILGLTLPLAAVLLGVASLTVINRNRDRYRGKGWAMGAIVLGTGVLGLALMAAAALSDSKKLWEK